MPEEPEPTFARSLNRPSSQSNRSGFTLTELLVVMAVLAVLAAVLLPVVAGARQRSATATCASNLRQIAVAFTQYCADYDQTFPGSRVTEVHTLADVDQLWFWQIHPYLRDSVLLHCPADNVTDARRALSAALPEAYADPDLPALSYGANWDMTWAAGQGNPLGKVAALQYPSQTLLAADGTEPWAFGPVYTDRNGVRWSHTAYANGPPEADPPSLYYHGGRSGMGHERHGAGSFVAFFDGHVALIPADHFTCRLAPMPGSNRRVSVQWPIISPDAIPP
jgi:prepilin-type N-terminal cleavage/methylation domain-containing protein